MGDLDVSAVKEADEIKGQGTGMMMQVKLLQLLFLQLSCQQLLRLVSGQRGHVDMAADETGSLAEKLGGCRDHVFHITQAQVGAL